MGGCKKVENGGCFVKKVDLSSTQGALRTVSVFFLFYILLIWRVRTHPTHPPCLRAWKQYMKRQSTRQQLVKAYPFSCGKATV